MTFFIGTVTRLFQDEKESNPLIFKRFKSGVVVGCFLFCLFFGSLLQVDSITDSSVFNYVF